MCNPVIDKHVEIILGLLAPYYPVFAYNSIPGMVMAYQNNGFTIEFATKVKVHDYNKGKRE